MRPARIQMRRTKGWRLPEGGVYVGRPTRWGNPFVVGDGPLSFHGYEHGGVGQYGTGAGQADMTIPDTGLSAAMAVALYRDVLEDIVDHPQDDIDREIRMALLDLRGQALACWCPVDEPCHADVLLAIANGPKARLT
jgi:hypothetical protein